MSDTLGLFWDRLCELKSPMVAKEGLRLLDEGRVMLAETAPRACCTRFVRAVDGVMRCVECGRWMLV